MLYALLRWAAKVALRWFYRDIAVIGRSRIPREGPVLLAGNHPNALVDALVIATTAPRPVMLTAKATLLEHPATQLLVEALGIIPIWRPSDVRPRTSDVRDGGSDEEARQAALRARNAESFRRIVDELEAEHLVLLFPEGKSHDEPQLAPLKTGLARIALQARDERGMDDLSVVPVGLTFERKHEPRSRVLVQVGDPIKVGPEYPSGAAGVDALTADVDRALRELTLNFPSREDATRVLDIAIRLAGVLDYVRPLRAPQTPLVDVVRLAARVEAIRQAVPTLSPAQVARAEAFLARLDAFGQRLDKLDIVANELSMSTTSKAGGRFAIRETAIALLALPVMLWGRVNHWLPLRLARVVTRRAAGSAEDVAMYTIASGAGLVLIFYVLQAAAVGVGLGLEWMFVYLATLVPAASWDFRYQDRVRHALRRMRTYFRFRRHPELQLELLEEATWLRREASAIDRLIGAPPQPERTPQTA